MDIAAILTGAGIGSGAIATLAQSASSKGMFSSGTLIVSFIISTIGLSYFVYGKKTGKMISLIVGVILMGFPYFVYNIKYMIIGAIILCSLPFFIKR